MMPTMKPTQGKEAQLKGTLAAFAAYAMWGFFPLYWKQLVNVESMQILAHRIFWDAILCIALLVVLRRFKELSALARNRKKLLLVFCCAGLVTVNWGLYIWAVNAGRIIESALGYYINPLVSVAFGVIFFKEKTNGWTRAAVGIAFASIVGAAIAYGSIPWVSIFLALSFASYAALKKTLGLDPILGLAAETLVAAPFALAFLVSRQAAGLGSLYGVGTVTTVLLVLGGAVTAIPLLFFAVAANSISMQKIGFMQYLAPTGMLLLGVLVYKELPSPALLVAFAGVIVAVTLYIISSYRQRART